ncbi:transcriptional regulator [Mesorhizobium sp.]|uniref:transcriptional regulator n=1 Tax=Mesorhizobium sp. TaxID=1871066 RepID=UPI000FE8F917|nr:transcriptional regulator [Mesorhizobium sp.]RWA97495.1 MAG: transcriptional regulator [Mesorhizobium sp.]
MEIVPPKCIMAAGRATSTLITRIRKGIALVALLATGVAFFSSPMFGAAKLAFTYYDPLSIAEYRLRGLSTDMIAAKIEEAIAEEDFDEAAKLVEIGQEHGHNFDPELVARTQESTIDATWRNSIDFADGFVTGTVSSPANLGGALAADYLVVGDLRDIAVEGTKAISGEHYDTLTLGLSLIGVATLVPGSGPIDVGASVIKTANKAKKLSTPMLESLGRISRNLVDMAALRKALSNSSEPLFRMPGLSGVTEMLTSVSFKDINSLNFYKLNKAANDLVPVDTAAARRRFSDVTRPEAAEELIDFTSGTATVASRGGVKAAFRSLGNADNPKDLARFGKLSEKTGDRTSTVIRLLGKGAIHLGELIYTVIAALIFAIAWMLGAIWSLLSFILNLRTLFR